MRKASRGIASLQILFFGSTFLAQKVSRFLFHQIGEGFFRIFGVLPEQKLGVEGFFISFENGAPVVSY